MAGVKYAQSFGVVSAAPYGSALILPISWAYIKVGNAGSVSCLCERCGGRTNRNVSDKRRGMNRKRLQQQRICKIHEL